MRAAFLFHIVAIAGITNLAVAQSVPQPAAAPAQTASTAPATQSTSPSPEPLRHESTSFDLTVHASLAEAEPLFGPEGERAWAGHPWNPKFLYPQPAHDEAGAVFKIDHGPFSAVWVCSQFDVEGRHFQYVYFMPDLMVATIDVRFKPIDATTTAVNVVYTRTAMSPEGNEHVAAMSHGDRAAGPKWQAAIDKYLASRKSGGQS
jgi:hypothetical protein